MGLEAERPDPGQEGLLGVRVAVHQEDPARESRIARPPPAAEVGEPVEQLRLIGVGREAADRADLAADLPDRAVDRHRLGTRLEMVAERPDPLVADEQDDRGRVVDEVPQVTTPNR